MKMKKALNILKQIPFWFFISVRILLLAFLVLAGITKIFEKADVIFAFSGETLELFFKYSTLFIFCITWILEIIFSFQLRKKHLFWATVLAGYYIIYRIICFLYEVL